LLLALLVFLANIACGTTGVAWEMSVGEVFDIEGFLSDLDYEALSNSSAGLCPICRELEKLAAELIEAETPDEQGSIIRMMLNILWQHPEWQSDLQAVVIEAKGKAWFATWVGAAYVANLAGRWVTIWGMVGLPSYCDAWCDSIPGELWTEIPPPPNCYCGGQEMM